MIDAIVNWWQGCNGEHVFGVCYVIGVVALVGWLGVEDLGGCK